MSSPRCTLNRWGQGTSCSTPKTESGNGNANSNTNAKEIEDKLKKMIAERNKIDNMINGVNK